MMRIRRADPAEAAFLTDLAFRSKALWGYDAAFMEQCRRELTVTADYIGSTDVYVLEEDGRVVGFHALEYSAPDRAELGLLFIEPHRVGAGFGSALLEHAVTHARSRGCTALVIQGDPHAEPFYRARGAVPIGSRPSASIPGRELPLFRIDLTADDVPV